MNTLVEILVQGIIIALIAVGVIQWVKEGIRLFTAPKGQKDRVAIFAWCALPASAFGAAALYGGGIFEILPRSGLALALGQMAYPFLVKIPKAIIKKLLPEVAEGEEGVNG